MVDVVVDDLGRDDEVKGGIDAMEEGHNAPCGIELAAGCSQRLWSVCLLASLLHLGQGRLGLLRGRELDDVRDEQVDGDEEVEKETEDDILTTVVVAGQADEDSILALSANAKMRGWM
jgi:hypothetical protein